MSGIYIHIPFCKQACHYCDFHFSTSLKKKAIILISTDQVAEVAELVDAPDLGSGAARCEPLNFDIAFVATIKFI